MGYRYETHLHTQESSACGKSPAAEYVPYYKELGYDGIMVTDHFYLGNTAIDRSLPWEQWVEEYCRPYREAKAIGEKVGLKVFFGWETSYNAEDFLIYGLGEEWLKAHPDVILWNQAEQYEHIKAAGGVVVQAHPFRERDYMTEIKLHPFHCDAWEIANAGNEGYMDELALRYAKAHGLRMTAGSDIHKVGVTHAGSLFGVETEKPLECIEDYMKLVLSGEGYRLIVDEDRFDERADKPKEFRTFLYDENNERSELYTD